MSGSGSIQTRKLKDGSLRYRAVYVENGKRKSKVLYDVLNMKDAKVRLCQLIAQREHRAVFGSTVPKPADVVVEKLFHGYKNHLSLAVKPQTYHGTVNDIQNTLRQLLRPVRVSELTPARIDSMRSILKSSGRSNRTINKKTSAIKTMLKWAVDTGRLSVNPLANLKKLPEGIAHQVSAKRAFSDAELVKVLRLARRKDHNLFLLFLGLAETGCRYGELRKLTWDDVSEDRKTINVPGATTKSGKPRWVPISPLLSSFLIHAFPEGDELLFQTKLPYYKDDSLRYQWHENAKVVGAHLDYILMTATIPKRDKDNRILSPHAFRHTFCTRLVRSGMPISHIQQITGHASANVLLQIYTHLGMDDVLSSYSKLVPPLELGGI